MVTGASSIMCAIIGVVLNKPTISDFELVKRVFLESGIRGLHATGMSFLPNWSKKIETIIESKPASYFVDTHFHNDNFSDMLNEDGNLYLIGHCRYSTSDLEYNQPISNENISIVHNGVMSQELPEKWEDLYGYITKTKNDSELLLKTIEEGKEPLLEWQNSSISAIELHLQSKSLIYYRNGKRPIYHSKLDNGVIITSTLDIMTRASSGKITAQEINKDVKVKYDGNFFTEGELFTETLDLQNA